VAHADLASFESKNAALEAKMRFFRSHGNNIAEMRRWHALHKIVEILLLSLTEWPIQR
jgi:hypothetical protein